MQRLAVTVSGQVQGVGFRPFCYRLASELHLSGWVCNAGTQVLLEIQGNKTEAFLERLEQQAPTLARIEQIEIKPIAVQDNTEGFTVRDSINGAQHPSLPADQDVCPHCLAELFDPQSRYYRYPFISCTDCGPRFSITRAQPFDRQHTSMADFPPCPACAQEYTTPNDRRFHAQTIACGECGPRYSNSIDDIVEHLRRGDIIAIKSLGGFHLVCDAFNHDAVSKLRQRKRRDKKPFAIMFANLASAEQQLKLDGQTRELLNDRRRSIVLCEQHAHSPLADSLAPGLNRLGVMLPYTPLHYLLFNTLLGKPDGTAWLDQAHQLCLVMTSANASGEALVYDNTTAESVLRDIADVIISHDREIIHPLDDSIVQINAGEIQTIRRARGYVPAPIKLAKLLPNILALGGHLKNTVCMNRGELVYVSQHIGDLQSRSSFQFFEDCVNKLLHTLDVKVEAVAHDLHPDFFSTRYAQQFDLPRIAVQHHHAHLAAVAAEHVIEGPCIGLALDGFGLGEAQQNWGGELIHFDGARYQRIAHLQPMRMPGGEAAAREPWRMAVALMHTLDETQTAINRFGELPVDNLLMMLDKNLNCPLTTSMGRLFDGVAALLGIETKTDYEGQAAMMLESLCTQPQVLDEGWHIDEGQLDLSPLLRALIHCNAREGSELFHGSLVAALTDWLDYHAQQQQRKTILLSGGCFLNRHLLTGLVSQLRAKQYQVYYPQQLPCNDGGLSLGQLWVAGLGLETVE